MLFKSKIKKIIQVEGMSCQHCVNRVKTALESMNGVSNVKVNLGDNTAVIKSSDEIPDSDIREVIEKAGYEVKSIEKV